VLGTDGFGRSDFRSKLREHFEINRHYIVVAALKALSEQGTVPAAKVAEAIAKYGIKADKTNPLYAHKQNRRQTWHWWTSKSRTSGISTKSA
jgi:pyruvate dehydrogenase E1 component